MLPICDRNNLTIIHNINLAAGNYFLRILPKIWAKYAIPNSCFNQIISNIAKSINSAWKDNVQETALLYILQIINNWLMTKSAEQQKLKFKSDTIANWAYN